MRTIHSEVFLLVLYILLTVVISCIYLTFEDANAVQERLVRLLDDATGNAAGWNPNGMISDFRLADPGVTDNSVVSVTVKDVPQFSISLPDTPPDFPEFREIALNPKTNLIYVLNGYSEDVSVIDGSTNREVAVIPLPTAALGVDVNTRTNKIYFLAQREIIIMDGITNTVEAERIPIFDEILQKIAVDSIHNKLYLINSKTQGIKVIDGATNTITGDITTTSYHFDLAVDPGRNLIYAANVNSDTVSVISASTDEVLANIPVGDGPFAIDVNPINRKIYVANAFSNDISVIDGKLTP